MAATQCIKAQRRGEDNCLKEKKRDLSALNVVDMVVGARRAGLNTSQTADPLGLWKTTENSHKKRKHPESAGGEGEFFFGGRGQRSH